MYGLRLVQLHTGFTKHRCINIDSFQRLLVLCGSRFLLINSQAHGGLGVIGLQNALPVLRIVFLQALQPPLRMVPACQRIAVRLRHQGITFAQEAAQAGAWLPPPPGSPA